jgi:site-specific recombinase XerD
MRLKAYKPTAFAKRLQDFLYDYSPASLGSSPNTLSSYCSTFRKYLSFREQHDKISADRLDMRDFTVESVEEFLDWIEQECGCKTTTRNQRMAALRSFCRYLVRKEPLYINQIQQILAIKPKKHANRTFVDYLTIEETSAIIKNISPSTPLGKRDAVLISLMYDSAARVQEIADLTVGDVKLFTGDTSLVYLTGKGAKTRSVPLSTPTYELLRIYFDEAELYSVSSGAPVFTNRNGQKLTRHGIAFILKKYVALASRHCESLSRKTVSPHTLRHSKALHLLHAGIDLVKIRDMLGHASVLTTEIYATTYDMDISMALRGASGADVAATASWHRDPGIMEKLAAFSRKTHL